MSKERPIHFWERRRKAAKLRQGEQNPPEEKKKKPKKWHERTSVTLSVAAVLIFVGFGFIHFITGVVSTFDLPFEIPFDVVRKESFGYRETFVNAGKILALPYIAAKNKYPLGCKALQRAGHMETGNVFESRMMNKLKQDIKQWQAQFAASLNKPLLGIGEQPLEKLRGETAIAETDFPSATAEDATSYNNRAIAAARAGQYEAAISNFTRAQQRDATFAPAWHNRALVYLAIGQLGQAISDFGKVIEIEPDCAESYINRAVIYESMSQYDEAISDYTRAIEIDSTLAQVYFRRSLVCYAKGEYDRAKEDVKKIQSLGLSIPKEFLGFLSIVSGD